MGYFCCSFYTLLFDLCLRNTEGKNQNNIACFSITASFLSLNVLIFVTLSIVIDI